MRNGIRIRFSADGESVVNGKRKKLTYYPNLKLDGRLDQV